MSKQISAAEHASEASSVQQASELAVQANECGPVLTSGFLADLNHSVQLKKEVG